MENLTGGFLNLNESFNKVFGSNLVNLNEAKKLDLSEVEASVREYFDDYDCPMTDKFNIKTFIKEVRIPLKNAFDLLMNIINEKVMKEIANGNYDNFDIWNYRLFNEDYDSYGPPKSARL